LPVTLTSLGGAGTVTGSKHLLEHDGHRLLVDCGLFQGLKALRELNWREMTVRAADIDAVVLTHAHLDHSGYLPKLVREGFKGPIYASSATIDVARLILLDSAFLQEKDAHFANRHGFSRHHPAMPLYNRTDAQRTLERFVPVPFHKQTDLAGGSGLLLRRAGHILGASTAEIHVGGVSILFSGDLGRFNDPMMPDPEFVSAADYVVVESTYGDRVHPAADPAAVLEEVIEHTVRRGGTVVIPAFAVGRAQSLLYHLWTLKKQGKLSLVPIYVDSPMATDATDLLCFHPDDHRLDDQACREACGIAEYVRTTDESKALTANRAPKVIISASGMATGGRVLHHMKAFGRDPRSTILFSGFQAAGTRGRALIEGQRDIKIHGEWIEIRAEVADLSMLSAHADSNEIMRWLRGFEEAPRKAFIVHGEPEASAALQRSIEQELGWTCSVSAMNQPETL
jgi:metallo-beta-lactamase family protein